MKRFYSKEKAMKKYINTLLLMMIFEIPACGAKNDPQQYISLTPPAINVTITRENCPSMEGQLGMTLAWTNGDTVSLPVQIDEFNENGAVTDTSKSNIGPGDIFSIQEFRSGTYRFYCSENRDIYGTIIVK